MWLKSLFLQIFEAIRNVGRTEDPEEKKIFILRIGQGLMIVLSFIACVYATVAKTTPVYYGLVPAFIFIWLFTIFQRRIGFLQKQAELRKNWGKEVRRKRDFSVISDFFNLRKKKEEAFFIDDRTWADLDMDHIYEKIERTQTIPGEQYLYYLLRKPELDIDELRKRNEIVKNISKNKKMRDSLQIILNGIGRDWGEGVASFVWDDNLPSTKPAWVYQLCYYLAIAAIILTAFKPLYWFLTIVPVLALNMYLHYREKKRIYQYLGSLFYLGRFLNGVRRIGKIPVDNPEVMEFQKELVEALKPARKIAKKTQVFIFKNDPIIEYFFIIFLLEVRTFYKVIDSIKRHKEELKKIYLTVGQLDAYVSIASFREGLPYYSEPELRRKEAGMEVEELYHLLLQNPVSNSFQLDKHGALITGSNMSGKSTLLRAVGVNVLLAQTIYTSLAKSYQANYYKLLTSIGRSDNVITGDSYYLVEAKALLRIIDELNPDVPILCIVDEIFRGTNSLERIAASSEVLHYLAGRNCLLFAATHDLELTEMLEKDLHNFHFRETVNERGLEFDYKLHQGPSTTRNAIQLLDFLGYPESIISGAREVIADAAKKNAGMWESNK